VYGTVLWLVLLGVAITTELVARWRRRVATLSSFFASIATRRVGRAALLVIWVFVGLHLFARYTLPGR
jgi:Family of unknown function (DUF6186)